MKVKELIRRLQQLDPEKDIAYAKGQGNGMMCMPISEIRKPVKGSVYDYYLIGEIDSTINKMLTRV